MWINYGNLFESWEVKIVKGIVKKYRESRKCLIKDSFEDLVQECLIRWLDVKNKYDPENITFSVITKQEMDSIAVRFARHEYDTSSDVGRVLLVKDMFVGELGEGECMLIASDLAINDDKDMDLQENLFLSELENNISIRFVCSAKEGYSMYSFANILDSWIKSIQKDKTSTIDVLLPKSIELVNELTRELQEAWNYLIAA